MGTQPMLGLIIKMSLPAMFSMLIQSLYNVVDSIFVAQVGENALTAVSLAFPIQMLMIAMGVGTGVGLNSLISRRLGEKKIEDANDAANHGAILGVATWILFALIGILFTKPFFHAFTQDPTIFQMGCDYTYVVTIFSFGVFVEINNERTLQATGNMIYPMIFQLLGAVTNIILDPIFIFGWLGLPAMGVKGAAIATVLGQIIAMAYSTYILQCKDHAVKVGFKHFKFKPRIVADIYKVGFPSIIMQAIGSVLIVFLNGILATFSSTAVAVLGVYYKLQSFVFMPVFGLNNGIMPIMGYNYGARNRKRLMDATRIGLIIAVAIMAVGTVIFMALPRQLLGFFNPSPQLLEIGIPALRIISLCFIFAALGIVFSTFFQAIGNGFISLLISLLRQLVLILPAAYLLAKIVGTVVAVWWAFPIAEAFSFLASLGLFLYVYRKRIKDLPRGAD
ncbi:MATE family efflux transporter [Oscillospiraceae bacterium NSJ-54]|uniref:Probable multidrug resistance protein NorM n=2 Tax=Zongyangia hominis TaxID=2763677 RepID=A0A926IC79_9FIRM|nr:MATE family efflux transporter [Zongyangia hominis]